ncbi:MULTISPECIES: MurR/RpiR family transcriptional regulator [Cupriavidus]
MPTESPQPPQTLDDLQAHLREHFASLSAQFQAGARYLLDHPQEVPMLSMRKIAADAGVQPATLVRLAQFLGFEGWQGLRELFVASLRGGSQPYAKRARKVVRESGSTRMLAEMLEVQHRNLERTGTASADAMPRAAELISAAPSVHVAGFRSCYPIAFTFHYLYRLFRASVHLVRGDAGTLEMELRAFAPRDAVVVASFAPYSQESIRVATAAHEAGCRVIALTDSTVAPIALHADCTLLFSLDSPSFFPSITAGVALAEALVEQLLAKKGKGAIKALELAEGQLHQTGAYVAAKRN